MSLMRALGKSWKSETLKDAVGKHLGKQHLGKVKHEAQSTGRPNLPDLLGFPEDLAATGYIGNSADILHSDFQQVFDKDQHQRLMTGGRNIGVGFKTGAREEILP